MNNNNNNNNNNNIHHILLHQPLVHLPLRPSSLQILNQRGFETIKDIYESKNAGGFTNLAAELGCPIRIAHSIYQEIEQLLLVDGNNDQQQQQQQVANNNSTNWTITNGPITKNQDYSCNKPNDENIRNHSIATTSQSSSSSNNDSVALSSRRTTSGAVMSAYDLVQEIENNTTNQTMNSANGIGIINYKRAHIITFCRAIDHLLGGGIPLGVVTEIAGAPGTGKSQLAMQLVVNASLPIPTGGVYGQAIYIDTEGSFSPERCYTMATALKQHVDHVLYKQNKRRLSSGVGITSPAAGPTGVGMTSWDTSPEEILNNIHVFRVHDETSLLAVLKGPLPDMIQQSQQSKMPIRLIVIDSIAFPFRSGGFGGTSTSNNNYFVNRTKQLSSTVAELGNLGAKYDLAIVAVNQMTTKRTSTSNANNNNNNNEYNTTLVPALGESWAHSVTIRLVLTTSTTPTILNNTTNNNTGGGIRRVCSLVKSPSLPNGSAEYQILESGIRGMDYIMPSSSSKQQQQQSNNNQSLRTSIALSTTREPIKRQRS